MPNTFACNQIYMTPTGQAVQIRALVYDRVLYHPVGDVLSSQKPPMDIPVANTGQWVLVANHQKKHRPFARRWSDQQPPHEASLFVEHYILLEEHGNGFVTCYRYKYFVDPSNIEAPLGSFGHTESFAVLHYYDWQDMLNKPLQAPHYEMGQVYRHKVTGSLAEIYAKVFSTLFIRLETSPKVEAFNLPGKPDDWELIAKPPVTNTPSVVDMYRNPRPNRYVRWARGSDILTCVHRIVQAKIGGMVTYLQYEYLVNANTPNVPIGRFGKSEERFTVSFEAWQSSLLANIPSLRYLVLDKSDCCAGDSPAAQTCLAKCIDDGLCQAV